MDTERLILRPLELTDAPAIQSLVSDRKIAEMTLNIPYPYPDNGAAEWISRELRDQGYPNGTFVILRRADLVLMGAIGLHPHEASQAEIGYWLGVPYWGQGYMTEAARRMIQYGFEALHLNRIYAQYFTHNPASGRVMQKAGMTFEGILRQHIIKWDTFVDVGCYSILRSEFDLQRPRD